jgi:transcription termination factor Rho
VEDLEVSVVLIDERPEEQPAWRKALGEVALTIAGAEMRSGEQLRAVELAVAQAKRKAEAGADAVLIIDSLSRLAVAADDPGATKPIFGAGRETAEEGAGSLTVIATVLTDGDDGVGRALATTENVAIALSGELAEAGVVPSIEVAGCRVVGEQELRDEAELAAARALRAELAELSATEAAQRLAERLRSEPSNEALLASLAK